MGCSWRGGAFAGLILSLVGCVLGGGAVAAPLRVFSLDQCSDQYVIALAPRSAIVGVSPRVGAQDSYLRGQSAGLPRRRATAEAVLAARAQVVVSYWGGDTRLSRTLARRNIQVVQIDETDSFAGVAGDIRKVAGALGRSAQGEVLIARMNAQLTAAAGAWNGRGALYLTPGGFTAGSGTLIDAMLTGAGLANAAPEPGYAPVSLERLVMRPPSGLVLGFFDSASALSPWQPGRHRVLRDLAVGRTLDRLPASVLGCPAWFAADATQSLAGKAAAHSGAQAPR